MNIRVKPYHIGVYLIWNNFLKTSNQDTFLFHRDFLAHHGQRFKDFSLCVYSENDLVALFPAHIQGASVYSHLGLTYGGLIHKAKISTKLYIKIYASILKYLHQQNIKKLTIKTLPEVYLKQPTFNALAYIAFKTNAKLEKTEIHSIVDLTDKHYSKSRIRGIKRGQKHQLQIEEATDFEAFWKQILIPNLNTKHAVNPLHALEDIIFLKLKFPKNVRLFNAYHNGEIVAGTTIFEMNTIAHSQYISGNKDKNILGSLDFLHHYLLETTFKNKRYFSFGTSSINKKQNINEGLLYWKEGFGTFPITQSVYSIETKNYKSLEQIFI